MKIHAILAVGIAALVGTSGCFWVTTKKEGQEIREDVAQLETRVEKKEQSVETKVARLQEVLDEATNLLKRNSADLGADVQAMHQDLRKLRGLVTEAQRYANEVRGDVAAMKEKVKGLDERVARLEFAIEELSREPADPGELWSQGKSAYDKGDYATAEQRFKSLVLQFDGHEQAAEAQYHRGMIHYKKKEYQLAIADFQRVWDRYEKSSLADDALYRAGDSAKALKHCAEARAYFGLLAQRYPRSELARRAKRRLRRIKGVLDDREHCLE